VGLPGSDLAAGYGNVDSDEGDRDDSDDDVRPPNPYASAAEEEDAVVLVDGVPVSISAMREDPRAVYMAVCSGSGDLRASGPSTEEATPLASRKKGSAPRPPVKAASKPAVRPPVEEEEEVEEAPPLEIGVKGKKRGEPSKPLPPSVRVVFDLGDAGATIGSFHHVAVGDRGILLVYDTRFRFGAQYIPPANGKVLDLTISDGREKYRVVATGLRFSLPPWDFDVLSFVEESREEETPAQESAGASLTALIPEAGEAAAVLSRRAVGPRFGDIPVLPYDPYAPPLPADDSSDAAQARRDLLRPR
jgi:hypothetical protein